MIPAYIPDHEEAAVALLTDKWREKPVTSGLVRARVSAFQRLEDIIFDVLNAEPEGVWLDAWGRIVGEPRNSRSDSAYLPAIKVRVRVNRSQGRAIDVIEVAKMLDAAATYTEYFPLAWEVELYNTPYGGDFVRLLTQTKATTSYGNLLTSTWPAAQNAIYGESAGSAYALGSAPKYVIALPTNPGYRTVISTVAELLTESGDALTTEGGDFLILE